MKLDLRAATFDEVLEVAFERADHEVDLVVDPALQIQAAERLFRDPALSARFAAREKGFLYFVSLSQPEFFGRQLWNHAVPLGARVSCAAAMALLYRELFLREPLGEASFMWFDLLEQLADATCTACAPVRRTVLGVLQETLAMPAEHCQRAALHGLNHWGTPAERAGLIDAFLAGASVPDPLRKFALLCREGKAP